MHNPKSDVDRIYFSRKASGRELEQSFKSAVRGLETYVNITGDVFLRTALKHESSKQASIMKNSEKFKKYLGCKLTIRIFKDSKY